MKKLFLFILIVFCSIALHAQHSVNDIQQYGGWYKVTIDITNAGRTSYAISQCYPSGEIFDVIGTEREKLPLVLKVLCMALVEEYILGNLDFEDLSFDEDGIYLEVTNFAITFNFSLSKPEQELLDELGPEIIDEYRNRKWP